MAAVSLAATLQPAGALTPLLETDVAAFSSRAEAWTEARDAHREAAHEQALELAEDARQAELDRVAAAEQAEAERLAAEAAARTTTTTRPPTTTVTPTTTRPATTTTTPPNTTVPDPQGSPTAAQWSVLRQCESSGNYAAVSPNQRYRGAYQFSQATWDWIAGTADPGQVGVDPATASPAVQDAMAYALWARQGWAPWPLCGAAAAAA